MWMIPLSGSDETTIHKFKNYLNRCFQKFNPDGIFLCQRTYALNIIFEASLLAAKPANNTLEQNHKLARATGDGIEDPDQF